MAKVYWTNVLIDHKVSLECETKVSINTFVQ
jgi:hypothetical protein